MRSSLEQAVSETAGGSAHIQGGQTFYGQPKSVQGMGQL
jgi:hypothetical protein